MSIKSSQTLVEEALKKIETLNTSEVKDLIEKKEITLIDVRDIREIWKEGTIADAIVPSFKKTSDSIVGKPLLSKTCLDLILVIFAIFY